MALTKEKRHFLHYVPIFGDLTDQVLEKIVSLGTIKKFKKGEMILIEEETGAAMFIIISGKVKVVRMDEKGKE